MPVYWTARSVNSTLPKLASIGPNSPFTLLHNFSKASADCFCRSVSFSKSAEPASFKLTLLFCSSADWSNSVTILVRCAISTAWRSLWVLGIEVNERSPKNNEIQSRGSHKIDAVMASSIVLLQFPNCATMASIFSCLDATFTELPIESVPSSPTQVSTSRCNSSRLFWVFQQAIAISFLNGMLEPEEDSTLSRSRRIIPHNGRTDACRRATVCSEPLTCSKNDSTWDPLVSAKSTMLTMEAPLLRSKVKDILEKTMRSIIEDLGGYQWLKS